MNARHATSTFRRGALLAACAALGLLPGCWQAKRPANQPASDPPAKATAVGASANAARIPAGQEASLFDTLANIARQSGEGDEPAVDFPVPPSAPDDGPDIYLPLDGGQGIVAYFASEEYARIKERNLRAIREANRQIRVGKCKDINVILIVSNDLGYGDVGVYGQEQIKTPNIDLLAQTGIRFTNFYAGSNVGMPSHCSLLTGLHTGNCRIRGTRETAHLRAGDRTLAEMMYMAGFDTAMFGAWAVGDERTPGTPFKQGFEQTYGYLNYKRAEDYYPTFLWRNDRREDVAGNLNSQRDSFSHDLVTREVLDYLDRPHPRPFFVMVSFMPPAGNLDDVPDLNPYGGEDWPLSQKQYAAIIHRLDESVGKIMDKGYELQQERPTLIILTSSNGPRSDVVDPTFFNSNGPFRGVKGTLHEGGIRVPMIVWGPRLLPASGSVSHFVWAAWDLMPTLGEFVGAWRIPKNIDGISQVPLWMGRLPPEREYLYWESHQGGFAQAIRRKRFKGVRTAPEEPLKLYNLEDDPAEENNLASSHPDIVRELEELLKTARRPSPDWPIGGAPPPNPAGGNPPQGGNQQP